MALAAPRKIVGRAIADGGLRSRVVIATQVGLEWKDGKVFRNASRDRILREATGSLRRLRTDYIDIYQVHWPDPLVPSNRREVMSAKKILFLVGDFRRRLRGHGSVSGPHGARA
jgi:aryl-alcohol dehydrogenase-like predicted oxidoreductase